jgi:hypothetical protein
MGNIHNFVHPDPPDLLLDGSAGMLARKRSDGHIGSVQQSTSSTMVLHAHISPGEWTTGLLMAAVQRRSLTQSTWWWSSSSSWDIPPCRTARTLPLTSRKSFYQYKRLCRLYSWLSRCEPHASLLSSVCQRYLPGQDVCSAERSVWIQRWLIQNLCFYRESNPDSPALGCSQQFRMNNKILSRCASVLQIR